MERIVEELIQIEQKANAIIEEITQERATLPQRIREEIARRTAEVDRAAEQTLRALRQASLDETNEKIEQITRDAERRAAELEAAYHAHREQWRKSLVLNIISGQ